ncbi:MAG: hypothetical protein U1E49_19330 [Hyphomicrobiaceae bacterium]
MGMWRLLLALVVIGTGGAGAHAADDVAAMLAALDARVAAQEKRIATLEAELETTKADAALTRSALARELAQPMLLLVGTGACPHGFTRIVTRVLILTRARNPENGHLFDAAGLTYEDPPGVGDNVYRDLDFCFRPANTVGVE